MAVQHRFTRGPIVSTPVERDRAPWSRQAAQSVLAAQSGARPLRSLNAI